MRTLAASNYKGGVGKITTAVNLAAIYVARGFRVLLIDLDPQASATDYFGLYDYGVSRELARAHQLPFLKSPLALTPLQAFFSGTGRPSPATGSTSSGFRCLSHNRSCLVHA